MPTSIRATSLYDLPRRELPPDFSDQATVERLSVAAVKLVAEIASAWKLTIEQTCTLMGGINHSTYTRRLRAPDKVRLSVDELMRASYLLGIYRALHVLYSGTLPDAWMQIPNTNPLFHGITPLDYVMHQGIVGLADVRELLDGYRGGK